MHKSFIRNLRGDDAYVYAAFCAKLEGREHGIVYHQIGRGNIQIFLGLLNHAEVYMLPDILFVHGAVGIGLNPAVRQSGRCGRCGKKFFVCFGLFRQKAPDLQKHDGKTPCAVSAQTNAAVLPASVLYFFINVLVCQIDAARVGDFSVYHRNFAVISIVLNTG